METRSISNQLAPALLAAGIVLAAWNWILRPERAVVWAVALLLLGVMAVALALSVRRARNAAAPSRSTRSVSEGVVYAALVMALSLTGKLVTALGAPGGSDLWWRATMVVLGAFFVVTGNVLPKTLTPLAALHCDAAKMQSFQRFAGWTWVLTGLTFANLWLILPMRLAQPLSMALLVGAMLIIATRIVRLRRTGQRSGGAA